MEAREYPFYGIGIIDFSMASADGEIQRRERNELKAILQEWSEQVESEFDVTGIIFELLVKVADPKDLTYDKGLHYIKMGSEYLTENLKEKFVFLIDDIAHAFPPVTSEEKAVITKFREDIKHL